MRALRALPLLSPSPTAPILAGCGAAGTAFDCIGDQSYLSVTFNRAPECGARVGP
jgi:hypothetical protein